MKGLETTHLWKEAANSSGVLPVIKSLRGISRVCRRRDSFVIEIDSPSLCPFDVALRYRFLSSSFRFRFCT